MIDLNELRIRVEEDGKGGIDLEEIHELLDRLEAWENVFRHLGTPDEVGNEWHALIDRLEAAESELLEEARLNGMGSEREASLLAKLEAAEKAINEAYRSGYATGQEEIEKERDALRTELNEIRYGVAVAHDTIKALRNDKATLQQMTYSLKDRVEVVEKEYRHMLEVKEIYQRQLNETEDERDALRAKIEAMEKQEPVYLFRRKGLDDFCTCSKERYESFSAKPRLFEVKTLYALPGAKGE
jgi:chromosome segregation ATPase